MGTVYDFLRDPEIARNLAFPVDLPFALYRSLLADGYYSGLYALERSSDGAFLGVAALLDSGRLSDWAECRYAIHPGFRGQGYAIEALQGLLHAAFEWTSARGALVVVALGHPVSRRVALSSGFLPVDAPCTAGYAALGIAREVWSRDPDLRRAAKNLPFSA